MLNSYEPGDGFLTGMPVSALDIETLRKNAHALFNTAQKFETPIYQQGITEQFLGVTPQEGSLVSGYGWEVCWHGAFQWHSGITKLRIEGYREIPTQSGGVDT